MRDTGACAELPALRMPDHRARRGKRGKNLLLCPLRSEQRGHGTKRPCLMMKKVLPSEVPGPEIPRPEPRPEIPQPEPPQPTPPSPAPVPTPPQPKPPDPYPPPSPPSTPKPPQGWLESVYGKRKYRSK